MTLLDQDTELDYDWLLKVRVAVARCGEMDLARWWTSNWVRPVPRSSNGDDQPDRKGDRRRLRSSFKVSRRRARHREGARSGKKRFRCSGWRITASMGSRTKRSSASCPESRMTSGPRPRSLCSRHLRTMRPRLVATAGVLFATALDRAH